MAKYNKITFSNSAAADSASFTSNDSEVDSPQYLNVLAGDLSSAALYSIGSTDTTMTLLSGNIIVPTDLISDTVVGTVYQSTLGANITMTATGQVIYDMAPIRQIVDGLAAGATMVDSFYYAIRIGDGTVSSNTVTVNIVGLAASLGFFQQEGEVTEAQNWQAPPASSGDVLTDGGAITAFAASGDLTTIMVTPAAGNQGTLSISTNAMFDNDIGSLAYEFSYSVSEAAVYATSAGFGEKAFTDYWTVTTANGTTGSFSEDVYGNIHAPVLAASAASSSIIEGGSVALDISATDHDDNASIAYLITGLPVGATLTNADGDALASSSGTVTLFNDAAHGDQLAGLTLAPDPAFVGNINLTITAVNTEGTAHLSSAPQNIALTVSSNWVYGTPGDDTIPLSVTPGQIENADALSGFDWMTLSGTPTGAVDIDLTAPNQLVSIDGTPQPYIWRNFEAVDVSQVTGAPVNVVGGAGTQVICNNFGDTVTLNGDNSGVRGGSGNDMITINGDDSHVDMGNGDGNTNVTVNGNYANVSASDPSGYTTVGYGDETISVTGNNYAVVSSNGNNTINLDGGDGSLVAGTGNDTIHLSGNTYGSGLLNHIFAGGGQDVITVVGDSNHVWGNFTTAGPGQPIVAAADPGNDQVTITGVGNQYFAGQGNNAITINSTNPYDESIENDVTTGDGNNIITLNGFDTDVLLGNGNNTVRDDGFVSNIAMGSGSDVVDATGWGGIYTCGSGSDTINIQFNATAQHHFEINNFVLGTDNLQLQGFIGPVSQTVQATGDPNTTGVDFFMGTGQSDSGAALSIFLRGLSAPLSSQDLNCTPF